MADKIKINTKTLQGDTSSIQKDLKQVQKKIEKMQTDVVELNRMWSGDANKAFNKAFNDDIKVLAELCNNLQSIITYQTTAKTEYDKCESKVSSMISSMNV